MTTRPEQRSSGRFDTRCISWHRYGGAPRFGSAHFRLAAHTLQRTTFSFPDSVFDPEHFGTTDAFALADLADAAGHDVLDDYVEAQVHGVIDLAGDVEAVVLDPCYRGTPVEVLRAHPGYRGPEFVALGESLAVDGVLTPRLLGDASCAGSHDEQALKRVWHYLARFGLQPEPIEDVST